MKAVFVDLLHLFNDLHGIYALSAVLKQAGVETAYVGTRSFKRALREIEKIQPDILLYSAFSSNLNTYSRFDRMVKERLPVRSLIGGPGATYNYQALKDSSIDAICAGEGEIAIVEYMTGGFKLGRNIFAPGEPYPKAFFPLVDLNTMPLPDREVIYQVDSLIRDSPSKQFFSSRGCPYQCTYCFNHQFRKLYERNATVRQKSVDYVLREINDVKDRYPLEEIVFNDDTFILNKRWFMEFVERYPKEVGIPYGCNVRANLIDEDIAKGLKQSDCRIVNWSLECGNDKMRNDVLKRNISNQDIYRAAELLTKYHMPYRVGNMLGLPGETFRQMFETVEMNIKVKPQFALSNIFVPYPGLELTRYAVDHGYCADDVARDLPKDYFTGSVLKLTPQEKRRIYKLFCLFPIFVDKPHLFHDQVWRRRLFRLPRFVLRFWYEYYYTSKLAKSYTTKVPLSLKIRMAKRYLANH